MRTIWIIGALFFFFILVITTMGSYDDYKVFKYGHIVQVTIVKVPFGTGSKSNGFLKFILNNSTYDKRLNGNVNGDFYIGEKIQLLYLQGYEDNFLFPEENPTFTICFCFIAFLSLGVGCIYYAIRNQKI